MPILQKRLRDEPLPLQIRRTRRGNERSLVGEIRAVQRILERVEGRIEFARRFRIGAQEHPASRTDVATQRDLFIELTTDREVGVALRVADRVLGIERIAECRFDRADAEVERDHDRSNECQGRQDRPYQSGTRLREHVQCEPGSIMIIWPIVAFLLRCVLGVTFSRRRPSGT